MTGWSPILPITNEDWSRRCFVMAAIWARRKRRAPYIALFSRFIPCGVREAMYLIDGILEFTTLN